MEKFDQSPHTLSDATIRRFLLVQLPAKQQTQFEAALFSSSQFEQRVRLAEFDLIDDYIANRLRGKELVSFQQKFLVTNARHTTLAVSTALQKIVTPTFASETVHPSPKVFGWPRLGWQIAFVVIALMILFASALVIRREPRIAEKIIPRRFRPTVVAKPTPETAHHATDSSASPVHHEDAPSLPAHEVSPQTIVLHANPPNGSSPVISLEQSGFSVVRLELKLDSRHSATFSLLVTTGSGEVVHNIPEIQVESADYVDFDVPRERLRSGDFQVKLTRIDEPNATPTIYNFRIQ